MVLPGTLQLSPSEKELKNHLFQKGLLNQANFEKIWKKYKHKYLHILSQLDGLFFQISPDFELCIYHFPENQCLRKIPLLPDHEPLAKNREKRVSHTVVDQAPKDSAPSQRELLFMNAHDGRLLFGKTLKMPQDTGLLLVNQQGYLIYPGFEKAAYLGATDRWLNCPTPPQQKGIGFDLYLTPNYLLVGQSDEALLTVISLETLSVIKKIRIFEKGGKALNIAFEPHSNKAFITNSSSSKLKILDFSTFKLTSWSSGKTALGNLWFSSAYKYLYLTVLGNKLELFYFDTEKLQWEFPLNMKGHSPCQHGYLAQDLMASTPDQSLLMLMSVMETNQAPSKWVIQVIDMHKVKTIRRYALKDVNKPDTLLTGLSNPVKTLKNLSFESMILAQKLMTPEEIKAFKARSSNQSKLKMAKADFASQKATPFVAYCPPPLNPATLKEVNQEGEKLELPPETVEVIVRLIVFHFYQATLTNLEVHSKEIFKLRKIAAKARQKLTHKLAIWVQVPAILGKFTLEFPLSRKDVLNSLEQYLKDPEKKYILHLCPECSQPMDKVEKTDFFQCVVCGFSFDLPEERTWRKTVSAEPVSALPAGYVLLPLPHQNTLLMLNPWLKILRCFEGKRALFKQIIDGVVLPNQQLLMTDRLGQKVAVYNAQNTQVWRAKVPLQEPVMSTYYLDENDELHYLIVDKGAHCIYDLDSKGHIYFKYPSANQVLEETLHAPQDIHFTPNKNWLITDTGNHRVLEVESSGEILNSWGLDEGLTKPIFARRLMNRQTLIVDQELTQVMIFDSAHHLLKRIAYWPAEETPFQDKSPPEKVMRLHNGELLFLGLNYFYFFNPQTGMYRGPKAFPVEGVGASPLLKLKSHSGERSVDKQLELEHYVQAIKKVPCLSDIPQVRLLILAEYLKPQKYLAGECIMQDIGQGNDLFFLLDGAVEVVKKLELNGTEEVVTTLKSGDMFGVIALVISAKKLNTRVVAQMDSQLLRLERTCFKKVLIRFPQFFHLIRPLALERQTMVRHFQDEKNQEIIDQLALKMMVTKVKKHPLLKGGNTEFYSELAQYLKAVAFLPHQIIYSRGESAGTVYFINEGQIGVLRKGEHQPQILLGDGQIFGEMSYFTDRRRHATLRTENYSRLYELEFEYFGQLLNKYDWLRQRLNSIVERRTNQNKMDMHQYEVQRGIARPDLPQAEVWCPLDFREDRLIYFSAVLFDLVIGMENNGEILWCMGKETACTFFQPYRMSLQRETAYITDTGNDRIIQLDMDKRQVIQIWKNQDGGLSQPRSATLTHDGLLLIADESNSRLLLLNGEDQLVWSYESPNEIMSPYYAEETPQHTLLFVDNDLHCVYEISRAGEILWRYGTLMIAGDGLGELYQPAHAHRLPQGETLICDKGNDRIVIIGRDGLLHGVYYGTEEHPLIQPKHCEVRENGDILVFSEYEDSVVRLDRWGEPIWSVCLQPTTDKEEIAHCSHDKEWQQVFSPPSASSMAFPEQTDIEDLLMQELGLEEDMSLENTLVIQPEHSMPRDKHKSEAETLIEEWDELKPEEDFNGLTPESPESRWEILKVENPDSEAPDTNL